MSGGKKLPVEKAIRCSASLVILWRRAAVLHEHALQFLPDIFDGEDAEIDADLGEDVADGAMTELVRDFLGCGECGENGIGVVARHWCGAGAWFARRGCGAGGSFPLGLWQRGLERRGHAQTARDAREDQGDVFGAEAHADPEGGSAGRAAGQILGHLLGAGDEFAEDAAQAAGARR